MGTSTFKYTKGFWVIDQNIILTVLVHNLDSTWLLNF